MLTVPPVRDSVPATLKVPAVTSKLLLNWSVVEAAALIVPVLVPVPWMRIVPVLTVVVPVLVNGMSMLKIPVPVLRVRVPPALLLKALVPPKLPTELSGCAVNDALLSIVPLVTCSCPATHAIVPLLVIVRAIPTAPELIVSVEVAAMTVAPEPDIVPPVQEKAPETLRLPAPSIVPPVKVTPVTEWLAPRVTVPLLMITVSAAPGITPQDQCDVLALQSFDELSHVQVAAEAGRGWRKKTAARGSAAV